MKNLFPPFPRCFIYHQFFHQLYHICAYYQCLFKKCYIGSRTWGTTALNFKNEINNLTRSHQSMNFKGCIQEVNVLCTHSLESIHTTGSIDFISYLLMRNYIPVLCLFVKQCILIIC